MILLIFFCFYFFPALRTFMVNGENFDPNPVFFKFMNYKSSSFRQLSQQDLSKLIDMITFENIYTIMEGEPKEIRRFFDGHDKITDAFSLFGRISMFLKEKGLNGFCPVRNVTCSRKNIYRSFDGLCNNLITPTWGSYLGKYNRFSKPQYEDGINIPRGASYSKEDGYKSRLPSPRKVSAILHEDEDVSSKELTHLYMQFGQFVSHDIAKSTKEDLDCCNPKLAKDSRCFNIDLHNDEFYNGEFNRTCMEFTRSDSHCAFNEWREQFNSVTSYLDCSTIYGSTLSANLKLRRGMKDGTLKEHATLPHFLPTRSDLGINMYRSEQNDDFVAGDERCQTQSALLTIHTLWFREHNRIARSLGPLLREKINYLSHSEQDEIIFQETRKLIVAEFTTVLYNEYLPILLPDGCDGIQLLPNSKYDPNIDASVLNEFSTVAYRFGHSLVQSVFEGIDQSWRLGNFFGDAQFATSFDGHGIEKELLGAIEQPCQEADRFISKELTHKLYLNKEKLNHTDNWRGMGSDLASLNIQRGRDHGIPDYNTVREKCGLPKVDNFYMDSSGAPSQFDEESWEKLKSVYDRVDDFDLFTAGLSEKKSGQHRVGETFHCIICEQFRRLKYGDRFFFTHSPDDSSLSNGLHVDLQNMILERKFSDIICENAIGIDKLPRNVFRQAEPNNPVMDCNEGSRKKLDFDLVAHHFKPGPRIKHKIQILYD